MVEDRDLPRSSSMATMVVTVTVADSIATVTLNNPPSNLLTTSVLKELDQAFGKLEANDAVRVIILTASGKFFSPGADIKELAELNTVHQGSELSGRGQALLNRVERFDKPVIAAINGACLGGGLERSEEHTSELQFRGHLVCRHLLEKKNRQRRITLTASEGTDCHVSFPLADVHRSSE